WRSSPTPVRMSGSLQRESSGLAGLDDDQIDRADQAEHRPDGQKECIEAQEPVRDPADAGPHEHTREESGEHGPAVGLARRLRVAVLRVLGWFAAHLAPEYSMWRRAGTGSPACRRPGYYALRPGPRRG